MKVSAALGRGFGAIRRYPALILAPLFWDVLLLGLNYWGLPGVPVWPEVTLVGSPPNPTTSIRGFLPSPLPTVGDLRLPMAPALRPQVEQASPWLALLVLVVIPLAAALVQSLFLALLAHAVAGRPLGWRGEPWRRGLRNWPAFGLLMLGGQLVHLLLPASLGIVGVVLILLFWLLVPYAIGVLDMPLLQALLEAPHYLWGRLGQWLGLALTATLITFLATAAWTILGHSAVVALLFYPALATALVGAAVAMMQAPEVDPAAAEVPAPGAGAKWLLPVVMLAILGAVAGARCIDAWKGWLPTREAALSTQNGVAFPPMFTAAKYIVVRTLPLAGGEFVVSRSGGSGLNIATLRTSRFGYQFDSGSALLIQKGPDPVACTIDHEPDLAGPGQDAWIVAGEIFDPRVAYLQIGGDRYPVGQEGPVFAIPIKSLAGQELRGPGCVALDAQGSPMPKAEVKQP